MARPTKKQLWKNAIGAKVTKLTEETVSKLKESFAIGASIEEACYYTEISKSTYYRWVKKNPKLLDELEHMRQRMPLKAKQNIATAIESGDLGKSIWLLERTQPKDYAETLKSEHSGELNVNTDLHEEDAALKLEFRERFKQNVIKRVQEQKKNEQANTQTKSKDGSQDAN